jgi:hypothetical protein
LSTQNIVKKKQRKSQTSQDKAVATNYHSRQTSGKNQNREYFTVFFGAFLLRNLQYGSCKACGVRDCKMKGKTREEFCPTHAPRNCSFQQLPWRR